MLENPPRIAARKNDEKALKKREKSAEKVTKSAEKTLKKTALLRIFFAPYLVFQVTQNALFLGKKRLALTFEQPAVRSNTFFRVAIYCKTRRGFSHIAPPHTQVKTTRFARNASHYPNTQC